MLMMIWMLILIMMIYLLMLMLSLIFLLGYYLDVLADNQDLIEGSPEVKSEENSCPQKIRREMEKWCRGVQIKLSDSGKNTKAMEAFR